MITIASIAEQKAKAATSLSIFQGFDLQNTKKILAEMLAEIGKLGLFSEYTKHDISHVDGMLKLLEEIIPEEVCGILTPVDWIMIVLSIYFHDLGMLITNKEFQDREHNKEYQKFIKSYSNKYQEESSEEERERKRYQDFVRDNHGHRIATWIQNIGEKPASDDFPIEKLLYDMLHFVDSNFRQDLAVICQSHSESFKDVSSKLAVDQPYGQGHEYTSNLLYVAAILRTADLMHINSERTPTVSYLLISPQDEYSRQEWVKQRSVKAIRAKKECNADNKIDLSIKQHRFEIVASFNDDNAYRSLMTYLDAAEKQLKETHEICTQSSESNSNHYIFPWDSICRDLIKTNKFSSEALKFDLDTRNILNLLVGHTLYSQVNVVLRELTQNSIDAVRLMNIRFKEGDEDYSPTVRIEWNSNNRQLIVKDNGTGMDEHIIRTYLMKVGSSRYQSEEFKKSNSQFHSISRFGIGVLTCFMISDNFCITTKYYDDEKVYSLTVQGMEKEFMLRYDADPNELINQEHGTTIKINVRDDADIADIEQRLREWIIVPQCHIQLSINGAPDMPIGYVTPKDAIVSYLNSQGIKIDETDYKIGYQEKGCAHIYYLLSRNKTFGYWQLCTNFKQSGDILPPIGYCIEGIRVSETTPGFNSRRFFVLVNCVGHDSPTTNVARDRLEENKELNNVITSVYKSYFNILHEQVVTLTTRYSLPWAYQDIVRQIDSLIRTSYDNYNLENRRLFDECLMAEAFMLVDDGEQYQMKSIDNLSNEIYTMESHAYAAAVSLVQDIHDCGKTSLGITKELLQSNKIQANCIYAESDFTSYFNQLFLSKYQVSAIQVDENLRKIEFAWKRDAHYWHCININYFHHHGRNERLFIQLDETVKVEPIKDEIAIKSKLGYFLLKNSSFCDLFCQILEKKDDRRDVALNVLGSFCLLLLANPLKANEKDIMTFFSSEENPLREDIWDFIGSKEEFISMINTLNLKIVDFSKFYKHE